MPLTSWLKNSGASIAEVLRYLNERIDEQVDAEAPAQDAEGADRVTAGDPVDVDLDAEPS